MKALSTRCSCHPKMFTKQKVTWPTANPKLRSDSSVFQLISSPRSFWLLGFIAVNNTCRQCFLGILQSRSADCTTPQTQLQQATAWTNESHETFITQQCATLDFLSIRFCYGKTQKTEHLTLSNAQTNMFAQTDLPQNELPNKPCRNQPQKTEQSGRRLSSSSTTFRFSNIFFISIPKIGRLIASLGDVEHVCWHLTETSFYQFRWC